MIFLAAIFSLVLAFFAYKNFKAAIGLLIILLPFYFIRFNIGPLPTSLLETTFLTIFLVWVLKYGKKDSKNILDFLKNKKIFSAAIFSFLFFSVGGILVSGEIVKALGIWRAYFLEPVALFFILVGRKEHINREDLIWYLGLSTVSISLLAIIQKITGQFFSPTLRLQDIAALNGRVTSFFTSPNAIGLYIAPMIPLLFLGLKDRQKKKWFLLILLLAVLAVILSVSEGAFVALFVGAAAALFLLGYKKIFSILAILAVVAVMLSAPLRENLAFKNHSGNNRLVLWEYTLNYLKDSPKNFVFGAGLRQWFEKVQKPVNDFKKIEPLIYPHNLFLNFWSEVGLLSMLSFVFIYFYLLFQTLRGSSNRLTRALLAAALVVFFVHGMVDVPYFKNDLSFLWWIICAIVLF